MTTGLLFKKDNGVHTRMQKYELSKQTRWVFGLYIGSKNQGNRCTNRILLCLKEEIIAGGYFLEQG